MNIGFRNFKFVCLILFTGVLSYLLSYQLSSCSGYILGYPSWIQQHQFINQHMRFLLLIPTLYLMVVVFVPFLISSKPIRIIYLIIAGLFWFMPFSYLMQHYLCLRDFESPLDLFIIPGMYLILYLSTIIVSHFLFEVKK